MLRATLQAHLRKQSAGLNNSMFNSALARRQRDIVGMITTAQSRTGRQSALWTDK